MAELERPVVDTEYNASEIQVLFSFSLRPLQKRLGI